MEPFKKSEKISKELQSWLNAFPESDHPSDRERWFKVISKGIETKQSIDFKEVEEFLKNSKEWTGDYLSNFIENKEHDYFLIIDFIDYYQGENK